jgi:hypothetical protein
MARRAVVPLEEREPSPTERLEKLRRLAARHGIPVEMVDRLLLRQRKVAELLDVSVRTVETMCAEGELEVVDVRGSPRIPMVVLLDYIESRRRVGRVPKPPKPPLPGQPEPPRSRARELIDAIKAGHRR